MDFAQIKQAAGDYQGHMTRFLRDMISHPSESCQEREIGRASCRERVFYSV